MIAVAWKLTYRLGTETMARYFATREAAEAHCMRMGATYVALSSTCLAPDVNGCLCDTAGNAIRPA